MRRVRNLALFGVVSLILMIGLAWAFRVQLSPFFGVERDFLGDDQPPERCTS